MTTAQVIQTLAGRGIKISHWTLRGLISRKELQRPRVALKRFDWTPEDIDRAEEAVRASVTRRITEIVQEVIA